MNRFNRNSVAVVRQRWFALVMVGGVAGSAVRWAVQSLASPGDDFPWATLLVNVAGCALLGALTAVVRARPHHRPLAGDLLGVGFCGGLTTMSTLAVEVAGFGRDGRAGMAAIYLTASLVLGIAAAWSGFRVERQLQGSPR